MASTTIRCTLYDHSELWDSSCITMSFIRKIFLAVLAVVYFFGMAVQAPNGGGCHQCGGGYGGGNQQPKVEQEGLLNIPLNLGNRVS